MDALALFVGVILAMKGLMQVLQAEVEIKMKGLMQVLQAEANAAPGYQWDEAKLRFVNIKVQAPPTPPPTAMLSLFAEARKKSAWFLCCWIKSGAQSGAQ